MSVRTVSQKVHNPGEGARFRLVQLGLLTRFDKVQLHNDQCMIIVGSS